MTGARGRSTLRRRLLLAPAIVTGLFTAWVAGNLIFPPAVTLPGSCAEPAFLAHRSNDVPSARAAADRGFCGIEVDVHWRDGTGLVVAHDPLVDNWTPAGSLTLEGLLDSLASPPPVVWLDFKNLSRGNARAAAAHLNAIAARRGVAEGVIVEARRPVALALFRQRAPGVIAAYWVPSRPRGRRRLLSDARLAITVGALRLPALSIPRHQLTPELAGRFRRLALFTWTLNTPEEVRTASLLGARLILSDVDPPVPRGSRAGENHVVPGPAR